MQQKLISVISRAVVVSSCIGAVMLGCGLLNKRNSSVRTPAALSLPIGQSAPVKYDKDGIITASMSANSTEAQSMQASAGSNISGVVVAFPVGSLSIATDISMREGTTVDKDLLVGELGLGSSQITSNAAAVAISSSQPIDLLVPMVIGLKLPDGAGLAGDPATLDHIGVIYRVSVQATGERRVGFAPATDLSLTADHKLLYPSKYFGWFQVVVFDQVVAKTERAATLPTNIGVQVLLADMALPSCGKADVGQTVYQQQAGQFQYCSTNGWQVIDLKGATGPAGATGATGSTGAAGAAGTPGNTFSLFDNANNNLGTLVGVTGNNALIKVGKQSNDTVGLLSINLTSGKIASSCATGSCSATTYYTTSDCTGEPYFSQPIGRYGVVPASSSTFRRASGAESTSVTTFQSVSYNGSGCLMSAYGGLNTYRASSTYAFPSGTLPPPYTTPVYVGP